MSFEEGSALAAQIQKEASTTDPRQGVLFYEVSAKDSYNVQDAFLALAYAHQTPMSRLTMCTALLAKKNKPCMTEIYLQLICAHDR